MATEKPTDINYRLFNSYFYLLILFCVFIWLYLPVWIKLVKVWSISEDYSHGYFIVPLSVYITMVKKNDIMNKQFQPSVLGLCLVIFSLLIYVLAHFAQVETLAAFSMLTLLAGVIIYLYGFVLLKEIIFPLAILLFMIPIPSQIYALLTVPLQLFVSNVSTWITSIIGMPVYSEGNVIYLPKHTLQVVQACSGLRSMISLLTISAVFAYLTLKSNVLRTFLFLSGIPTAIVMNIFRVLAMVLAFYYFNYDLTYGSVHKIFGMIVFIFAFFIIAGIKGVLSFWEKSTTAG